MYLEWLKVQTSNFACGLIVRDIKPKKMKNWSKRVFSDFRSESACKGAHGFTSQWS